MDELTAKQLPDDKARIMNLAYALGSMLFANAGTSDNPMAFPGYNYLYTGTYTVYRWMLQHPVLRLVRAISTAPILASSWEYEALDKSIPTEWVEAVKLTFNRLRSDLIRDFYISGRDMGWSGGEQIWQYKDGRYDLARVKPVLQDITDVLRDKYGNITGLRNNAVPEGTQGGESYIDLTMPYKGFHYAYDPECDNPYGRSWLENARMTAWRGWLDSAQQLQKLGAKITGIVTVITSPAGTFPGPLDANGQATKVSYEENAKIVIKALAAGAAGVWFPSLGLAPDAKGNIDAMKVLIELAGKSLTNINVLDFGQQSQALSPILDKMKHEEELMFNAGLRSARVGLEAEHGAKEDAGVHTDTGTVIAETEDEAFAKKCQCLVNNFVVLNFSAKAVDKIIIKTPSLIDRKTSILRAFLLALLNDPEVVEEVIKTADMDRAMDVLQITRKKTFDAQAVTTTKEKRAKAKSRQQEKASGGEPQGGRPKKVA
jgi:hypothetical protein